MIGTKFPKNTSASKMRFFLVLLLLPGLLSVTGQQPSGIPLGLRSERREKRTAGGGGSKEKEETEPKGGKEDGHIPTEENEPERLEAQSKRFMVKYKNRAGKDDTLQRASAVHKELDDNDILVVEMSDESAKRLDMDENVESVDEDTLWYPQGFLERELGPVEARRLKEQIPYGIETIQADQVGMGTNPVKVCVVDTGIAYGHPDLDNNKITGNSRSSNVDDSWMKWSFDARGHGSHVAGIVAAKAGNGVGVRGVGDIELFIVRAINDKGSAYQSDVYEAINQCIENPEVRVINCSLGGSSINNALDELYSNLTASGYLIFGAAGNDGKLKAKYPASHKDVVSVAACQENENYWPSSNYGKWIELSAPGHQVFSTVPSGNGYSYSYYSGTSMAAPHASGTAAILWSHFPDCTNHQIRYAMAYTAKDVGNEGCDNDYGYGIVQAKAAFDFLSQYPCNVANWGQTPSTGECSTIDVQPELPPEPEQSQPEQPLTCFVDGTEYLAVPMN